jgi:hypothetical protein
MSLSASRLDNLETFSRSDPFLRISKMRENGEWVPVLKTEVVPNNLNPAWRPFRAALSQLCNCDPHRPLLLEVGRLGGRAAPAPLTRQGRHGSRPWPRRLHSGPSVQPAACPPSPQVFDAEASGAHRLIGAWQGSLQALRDAAEAGQPLPLVNEKKRAAKAGYVSSGEEPSPQSARPTCHRSSVHCPCWRGTAASPRPMPPAALPPCRLPAGAQRDGAGARLLPRLRARRLRPQLPGEPRPAASLPAKHTRPLGRPAGLPPD